MSRQEFSLPADPFQVRYFFLSLASVDWDETPGAPSFAYALTGDFSGTIDTYSVGNANSVLLTDGLLGGDISGGNNRENYFRVEGGKAGTLSGTASQLDHFLVTGGTVDALILQGSGDTAAIHGGSVGRVENRGSMETVHIDGAAEIGSYYGRTLTLSGDAKVRDITLTGGTLTVTGNAEVHDVTVSSGTFYLGGFDATQGTATVTGDIRIRGGATLSLNASKADLSGATIHIDMVGLSGVSRAFMVNTQFAALHVGELSISVASDQAAGAYSLVGGASSLQGYNFTLRIDGTVFGVLGDGNDIVYNGRRYSLGIGSQMGTGLQLDVETVEDILAVAWPDAPDAPKEAAMLATATGSIEAGDYLFYGANGKAVYSAVAAGGTFGNFTGSDDGLASYYHLTDSLVSDFNGKRISLLLAGDSALSGTNRLRELYLYGNSSLAGDLGIEAGGTLFVDGAAHTFDSGTSITFALDGMTETDRALISGNGAMTLLSNPECTVAVSPGAGQTLGRFLLAEDVGSSYGSIHLRVIGETDLSVNQNYEAQEVRYALAVDADSDLYFHMFQMHRVNWNYTNQGPVAALELHDGFSGSIQSTAYLVADKQSANPSYSVYFAEGSNYGDILGGSDQQNAFYVAGGTVASITGGGNVSLFRIAGGRVGTIRFGATQHSRLFVDSGAVIDNVIGNAAFSQTMEIRGNIGSMTGIHANDPVISVWENGSVGYFEGKSLSLYHSATLGSADITGTLGLYNSMQTAPVTITGTVNLRGAASSIQVNSSYLNISEAVFNIDLTGTDSRSHVAFTPFFLSFSPGALMVTVSADQALNTYTLAGVGEPFSRSFTLRVGGISLGDLRLDDTRIYNGRQYTLIQNASTVSLRVTSLGENTHYSTVDWHGLGGNPSDARNSWSVVDDAANIVSDRYGNQVYSVAATGVDCGSMQLTDDTRAAYVHVTDGTVAEVAGNNLALLLDGDSSGAGGELRVRHLCLYGTSRIDYATGAFVSGVLLLGGSNTIDGRVVIDGKEGMLIVSGTGHAINAAVAVDFSSATERDYPVIQGIDGFQFADIAPNLTVNVSSRQESGLYLLADNVPAFTGNINFTIDNLSMPALGIGSAAQPYGVKLFSLEQENGNLYIKVENSLTDRFADWHGQGRNPFIAKDLAPFSAQPYLEPPLMVSGRDYLFENEFHSAAAWGGSFFNIAADGDLESYLHLTNSTVNRVNGQNLSLLLDGASTLYSSATVANLYFYGSAATGRSTALTVSGKLLLDGANTLDGTVAIGSAGYLEVTADPAFLTVNATITFDLAGATPERGALVRGVNGAAFANERLLAVTVSETQAAGDYLICSGVGEYHIGVIRIGERTLQADADSHDLGDRRYALRRQGSDLTLRVLALVDVDWSAAGMGMGIVRAVLLDDGFTGEIDPKLHYLYGVGLSVCFAAGKSYGDISAFAAMGGNFTVEGGEVNSITASAGPFRVMQTGGHIGSIAGNADATGSLWVHLGGGSTDNITGFFASTAQVVVQNGGSLGFYEGTALRLHAGGTLGNADIYRSIRLFESEGVNNPLITGSINLHDNATFSRIGSGVYQTTVNIDLTGEMRTQAVCTAEISAAVTDWSITVNGSMANGDYLLFGDAASFTGSFTVKNAEGILGALAADDALWDDTTRYSLVKKESQLYLNVQDGLTTVDWSFVSPGMPQTARLLEDGFSGQLDPALHTADGRVSVCFTGTNRYGNVTAAAAGNSYLAVDGGEINAICCAGSNFFLQQSGGHIGSIDGNMDAAVVSRIDLFAGSADSITGLANSKSSVYVRGGSLGYFDGMGALMVFAGSTLGGADVYHSISLIGSAGPAATVISGTINLHDNAMFSVSDYDSGVYHATVNIDLTGEKRTQGVCLASHIAAVADWTITVDGSMEAGEYRLLRSAASFAGSLTLKTAAGTTLGALGVGNELWDGDRSFRFVLDSYNNLSLRIRDGFRQADWTGVDGGPSAAAVLGDAFTGAIAAATHIATDNNGGDVYSVCTEAGATYGDLIYGGELDNYLLINGGTIDRITGAEVLNGALFIRMEAGTVGSIDAGYARTDGGRATATVEINGGSVTGHIFGSNRSGNGAPADIITISVGAAEINCVYGGGAFNQTVNPGDIVISEVNIVLDGYTSRSSNAYVFGGAASNGAGGRVDVGAVSIRIEDAASGGNFHGGGYGTAGGVSHVETVDISISGGDHSGYFYCGGRADNGGTSTTGAVTLSVTGGTFNGYLFGGGYSKNGDAIITGNVDITISGGTFNGTVYGGAQKASNSTGYALVSGDVTITLDVSGGNVVSFRSGSGITLGGNATSQVAGDTKLILTGDAANFRTGTDAFNGWLNAGGGTDAGKTHTLAFHDFSADSLLAKFQSFNHLEFSGSTSVTIGTKAVWGAGTDYTFRLAGRAADPETAFLKQEFGSLGMTEDTVFHIDLDGADLSAESGRFLLIDGIDNMSLPLDAMNVSLDYNGDSFDGKFNGGSLQLPDEDLAFNLVYEQNTGSFALDWSRACGSTEPDSSTLYRQNGMLA